ncbi:MAG: hypothetical protein M0P01_06515 [Treponema sp.]|nr:hypothetical protein [Treponema sp.]
MKKYRILLAVCVIVSAAFSLAAADNGKTADAAGTDAALEKKGSTGASVKCESGKIKLILRGNLGTWQLYAVNKEGGSYPLFVDYDEFASTYFLLRAGKTEYKLNESNGIESVAAKTAAGGSLLYTIPKAADVSVEFTFMKTTPDCDDDMIQIRITVTNRKTRTDMFALKGVFDTFLGEKTDIHFSTSRTKAVNSEAQFRTMKNEKWILSQGGGYGVQLLLDGGDITPPSLVTLGNKDIISLPLWEPVASTARSFDNVMSYNNSAVAVNWEKFELKPAQSLSVVFYIAVSADDETPAGAVYLASFAGTAPESAVPAPESAVKQAATAAKTTPDVPFDVITEEKLDPAYIQALINKINALEDDDKSVNRDELLRLNAELDAILAKLRQQ